MPPLIHSFTFIFTLVVLENCFLCFYMLDPYTRTENPCAKLKFVSLFLSIPLLTIFVYTINYNSKTYHCNYLQFFTVQATILCTLWGSELKVMLTVVLPWTLPHSCDNRWVDGCEAKPSPTHQKVGQILSHSKLLVSWLCSYVWSWHQCIYMCKWDTYIHNPQ